MAWVRRPGSRGVPRDLPRHGARAAEDPSRLFQGLHFWTALTRGRGTVRLRGHDRYLSVGLEADRAACGCSAGHQETGCVALRLLHSERPAASVTASLNGLCVAERPLHGNCSQHIPARPGEAPPSPGQVGGASARRGRGGHADGPGAPPPTLLLPPVGCSTAWTRPGLRLPADLPLLRFPPPLGASVSGPSPEARTSAKAAASPARKQQRPGPGAPRGGGTGSRAGVGGPLAAPLPRGGRRAVTPAPAQDAAARGFHPSESRDACRGFCAKPCSCHRARGTAGVTAPAPLAVRRIKRRPRRLCPKEITRGEPQRVGVRGGAAAGGFAGQGAA